MLSFKPAFSLSSFHFHQEALEFLFTFCHKGGVICIFEVIDISPSNLDSIEEGVATLSSILAWRIPWTEEPGVLQSIGLQRVGHH